MASAEGETLDTVIGVTDSVQIASEPPTLGLPLPGPLALAPLTVPGPGGPRVGRKSC